MGTIFVPIYVTLSMRYFEIKLYSVCTFKYGEVLAELLRKTGTVFRMTAIQFYGVLLTLNSNNPSIQFTVEYSIDQIPFLDILLLQKIITKIMPRSFIGYV